LVHYRDSGARLHFIRYIISDGDVRRGNTSPYFIMNIKLPVKPMSMNKAWRGGRRFRTNDYLDYEKELFVYLPREKVSGMVEIFYTFYLKNHKTTDTSNLIKLLEDVMVKAGVIDDDRFVYSFHAKKIPSDVEHMEIDIVPYTSTT
jgi:Holliday junction resolvase RusA-like endonuclease